MPSNSTDITDKADIQFTLHDEEYYREWHIHHSEDEHLMQTISFTNNDDNKLSVINIELELTGHNPVYTYTQNDYKIGKIYKVASSTISICQKEIDTSNWPCKTPHINGTIQSIPAKEICDGTKQCHDGSDETSICVPDGWKFVIFYIIISAFIILGVMAFVWRVKEGKFHIRFIHSNKTCFREVEGLAKTLIQLFQRINLETDNTFFWDDHRLLIKKLYKPCQKTQRNKKVLQLVHALSQVKEFEKPCFRLGK